MLVSRLAVGCPLLSTLVKSNGADCIALKGSGDAAGLFALPFTAGLPRMDVVLLFVPLAGEARIVVELESPVVIGTCTMLTGGREYVRNFVYVGCSQVEISYIIDIEWVEMKDWRSVWQMLGRPDPLVTDEEYRRQNGCADIDEVIAYYFGGGQVDEKGRMIALWPR